MGPNVRKVSIQRVRDAINGSGHTLQLLPPYSLYLNAAESVFGGVKDHVRQEIVQVETLVSYVERDDLMLQWEEGGYARLSGISSFPLQESHLAVSMISAKLFLRVIKTPMLRVGMTN
jgi:hypothetical protein